MRDETKRRRDVGREENTRERVREWRGEGGKEKQTCERRRERALATRTKGD